MKRELKSYLAGWLALYLAAVCLPFLLAGCASDSAAPWPVDGETTSVTLRMSVAGAVGTRTDGTEDEYATLENRINTLRVLVVTDGNKIAVNHKLTPEELAAQTVTIENVGFDLDLAQEVCDRNGWILKKQPIEWNSKDMVLNSGSISCIWNGFTMNGREDAYTRATVKTLSLQSMADFRCKILETHHEQSGCFFLFYPERGRE